VELIDDLHRGLAGVSACAAAFLQEKFGSSAAPVLAALVAPAEFADLLAMPLDRANAPPQMKG
jgi:hypothetical protein